MAVSGAFCGCSGLNVAVSGAFSADMDGQAKGDYFMFKNADNLHARPPLPPLQKVK